jgi:predicted kinase
MRHFKDHDTRVRMVTAICLHTALIRDIEVSDFMAKYSPDFSLLSRLTRADQTGRLAIQTEENRLSALDDLEAREQWSAKPMLPIQTHDQVLTILVGIPGSGKSHIRNRYGEVFSTDDTLERIAFEKYNIKDDYERAFSNLSKDRRVDWVKKTQGALFDYLRTTGKSAVYDATNLTKKNRRKLIRTAHQQCGADIKIRVVMVWRDFEKCLQSRSKESGKYISDFVYRRFFNGFSFPSLSEGIDWIDHIFIEE